VGRARRFAPALRWSLAKLRPLLDSGSRCPLVTDRERVAFVGGDDIDVDVERAAQRGFVMPPVRRPRALVFLG